MVDRTYWNISRCTLFHAIFALLCCVAVASPASAMQCVKINNSFTSTTVEWYSLRAPNNFHFEVDPIERTVTPKVNDGSAPVQTDEIATGKNPIVCRHAPWEIAAAVVRFNGMGSLNAGLTNTLNVGIGIVCGECGTMLDLLEPYIDSNDDGFVDGGPAEFRSGTNDKDIAYAGVPGQYRALTISGAPTLGYHAGINNDPLLKGKGLVDPPSPMYHNEEGAADLNNYNIVKNSFHPGNAAYVLENTTVQGCAALCSNNVLSLVGIPGKCVGFNYTFTPVRGVKIFTCSIYALGPNSQCGLQSADPTRAEVVNYYESRSAPFLAKPAECSRTGGE